LKKDAAGSGSGASSVDELILDEDGFGFTVEVTYDVDGVETVLSSSLSLSLCAKSLSLSP